MKTKILLVLTLFFSFDLLAQKSVNFNGSTYKMYPHFIEANTYSYEDRTAPIHLTSFDFQFSGVMLPPCIGDLPDGDYVFYTTNAYWHKMRDSSGKKVWKESYYVYATCKIVGGKKNGFAKLYSEYNQFYPYDSIPYKDDLIHGGFNFNSMFLDRETFGYYNYDVNYSGHLNYQMGIPDGVQNITVTKGKKNEDTLSALNATLRMGILDGPFYLKSCFTADIKSGYTIRSGNYKKDMKEGQWLEYWHNKSKTVYNYVHDKILEEYQYKNDNLYRRYVYSRDSVERLLAHEHEELIPHVFYSWQDNYMDRDFVCYKYDVNGNSTYTFVYGNMARPNFYLFFGYKSMRKINDLIVLTDSISLKPSRWNRYASCMIQEQYLKKTTNNVQMDSFNSMRQDKEFYYSFGFLKTVFYNKKGKVIDTVFAYNYKELIYGVKESVNESSKAPDVVILQRKDHFVRLLNNEKYGSIYEFEYTKGDYKGMALKFDIFTVDTTEYMTRNIYIPLENGNVVLIDTIYENRRVFRSINENFFEHNVINQLMLSESGYQSSEIGMNFLYEFFTPKPVVHRAVLLNGQPYTGELYLKVRGWRNASKFDVDFENDSEYRCNWNVEEEVYRECEWQQMKRITINMSYKTYNGSYRWKWKWGNMPANWHIELDSGLFDGELKISEHSRWSSYDKYNSYFVKNKVDGKIRRSFSYHQNNDYIQFDTGKLSGQVMMYDSRGVENVLRYKQGRMTGDQLHFNVLGNGYLDKSISVVNDTMDGAVWKFSISGYPLAKGNFTKGSPHGYFYTYYPDTSNGKCQSRIQFDHGALVGEMLYYNSNNVLVEKVQLPDRDSIEYYSLVDFMDHPFLHHSTTYNELRTVGYSFIDSIEKIVPARAYYSLYYPDGARFAEGWKIHGEAVGEWKFYRKDGLSIYKVILFQNLKVSVSDTVAFNTFGKVTAYYEDGKKMFEGLATDSRSRYSCESHSYMPIEDDLYSAFYDTLGNNLLLKDSAYVVENQITGFKFKEGAIVNGLKEGLWLYYDQNGNLEMFGLYKNGKKSGRWVVGDLSGVHVDPFLCFLSADEFMAWMMKYGNNLTFTEDFYNDGVLIRSSKVRTKKKKN